ncbi:hypothetical protein Scep_026818 [Stephania cephalantha]|uniref:DNA-directed RNA polymerase subunit beta n=1 Tax=Stephania cephalantha TaxID=152367 RepID=A0AAP0EUT1_9MAGN
MDEDGGTWSIANGSAHPDHLPNGIDDAMDIDLAAIMDIVEDLNPAAASTSSSMKKSGKENEKGSPSSMDEDEDLEDLGFSEEYLTKFCKDVSVSFFNQYGLISHQINSFNDFVNCGLQRLFDSVGEISVEPGYDPSKKGDGEWKYATISFGAVSMERPAMWLGGKPQTDGKKEEHLHFLPKHARLQNMTYAARMKVEMKVQVYTQQLVTSDKFKTGVEQYLHKEIISEETKPVLIGKIPVMVKSNLCWMEEAEKRDCDFDHGGYFVIKGTEKVFIAQEQICLKRLWIAERPCWTIAYRSELRRRRLYVKIEAPASEKKCPQIKKVINVHFLSCHIPLWILMFALGMSSDKEIVETIDVDMGNNSFVNLLLSTIYEADELCDGFRKDGKALKYIEEEIKSLKFPPEESISECLEKYLLPFLGNLKQKAIFLAYMVKSLLQATVGQRKCDNRDEFRNKRFELAGELLEREIKIQLRHAQKRMVKSMQRDLYGDRLQSIDHYIDASIITNGLSRAFSTGAWAHAYNKTERTSGVVATLRRANPLQTMADMRKTRQQVNYTGGVIDARFPNPSHWGRACFLSTPDGENCGLVKNMAVTGLITTNLAEPLLDMLIQCGMEKLSEDVDLSEMSLKEKDKIFLNGDWVGLCKDSLSFVVNLRTMRRGGVISPQVEIKRDQQHGEVRIFTDAGRILRPLLVVENLKKIKRIKGHYNFLSLLEDGIIELVGVEEEEDCRTAWGIKKLFMGEGDQLPLDYTHCELNLSFLLGLSCGMIPFANHDHARRVLYQSEKHSQQAIGFSTTNSKLRVDTLSHQLYYPQTPLFRTAIADCIGKPDHPKCPFPRPEFFNGQNAIVAVNVHLGYNQEDSLVMNRASLERGMFRTAHTRSYKAEVENKELTESKRMRMKDKVDFCKVQSKIGKVDNLDDDGFPYIGANLESGHIVIGRCAESGADHSIKLKHTENGRVEKVVLSANDDGTNYATVSLRQVRSPCVGDKFSSMHGQKGVVGLLESQENFPFTCQGIVPDIVINPHAFPTRQTPGQLLEAAFGKGIACGGSIKYATPFSTPSVDDIMDQLHSVGFSRWGGEKVYNGHSGEMMQSMIFIGPTFYQRLIHMAEDKVKFRNTGPVHPLTRQPVADRKRFGGVKFGEMERDCLLAHGAASNLYERLFTLSDFSHMHICGKCNNVANVIQRSVPGGSKVRGPYCRFCSTSEGIVKVQVPYGAKLLYQELFSMGICIKFGTEPC